MQPHLCSALFFFVAIHMLYSNKYSSPSIYWNMLDRSLYHLKHFHQDFCLSLNR